MVDVKSIVESSLEVVGLNEISDGLKKRAVGTLGESSEVKKRYSKGDVVSYKHNGIETHGFKVVGVNGDMLNLEKHPFDPSEEPIYTRAHKDEVWQEFSKKDLKRHKGIVRATDKLATKADSVKEDIQEAKDVLGETIRVGGLKESIRAHDLPAYLYGLGKELGSDIGFHKQSRIVNPKTKAKDYVFHVDKLSDEAKERIKKDYPEAVLGLSSSSQYAPENRSPVIVMPGR